MRDSVKYPGDLAFDLPSGAHCSALTSRPNRRGATDLIGPLIADDDSCEKSMDEPPRAVTAAAARAAPESPPESPEAGAGRAARHEEERAAHWGERRAQRERDRSASPPPPAGLSLIHI